MRSVEVDADVGLGDRVPSPHVRCDGATVEAVGEWDGRRAVYASCDCGQPVQVIDGVEQMGLLDA